MTSVKRQRVCYLHVGPHKTGSSSIQHFMSENAEELARHGIVFPTLTDARGRSSASHGGLTGTREFRQHGRVNLADKNWAKIDAIASEGRQDIILSSELFSSAFREAHKFEAVVDVFDRRGYRVVVIAYVRDQPDWLNSWFVQNQKRFFGRDPFEAYIAAAEETGRVDPWRYLENYIDNPRVTLDVIHFEQAARDGLEADFARRVGVPADAKMKSIPRRNPNAGAHAVYAAQQILSRTSAEIYKMKTYKRVCATFKRSYRKLGWTETPFVGLDQALYDDIRERYREGNERFAQRFFGKSWEELYPAKTRVKSVFDPARATEQEKAEIDAVVAAVLKIVEGTERKMERRTSRRVARDADASIELESAETEAAEAPKPRAPRAPLKAATPKSTLQLRKEVKRRKASKKEAEATMTPEQRAAAAIKAVAKAKVSRITAGAGKSAKATGKRDKDTAERAAPAKAKSAEDKAKSAAKKAAKKDKKDRRAEKKAAKKAEKKRQPAAA